MQLLCKTLACRGSLIVSTPRLCGMQDILPESELAALLSSNHRPNYVLAVLSCTIEVRPSACSFEHASSTHTLSTAAKHPHSQHSSKSAIKSSPMCNVCWKAGGACSRLCPCAHGRKCHKLFRCPRRLRAHPQDADPPDVHQVPAMPATQLFMCRTGIVDMLAWHHEPCSTFPAHDPPCQPGRLCRCF